MSAGFATNLIYSLWLSLIYSILNSRWLDCVYTDQPRPIQPPRCGPGRRSHAASHDAVD